MEILHIYKNYHPVVGGIENHVRWLAEAQAAAGHRVTVLVCSGSRRTEIAQDNGVSVIRAARLMTVSSMPLSIRLPVILARMRPDVVHLHMPYPLGATANLLIGRGRVTVITYHSDIVRQWVLLKAYAPLLRLALRSADAVIATSPQYVETSPWLRPLKDRCTIVPLGVDPSRFLPVNGQGTSVLFVGKLRYYKGLDTLLHAMARLPETKLVIVGDGPNRPAWQKLALDLRLGDRVVFAGEVPDEELPGYYARAALLVLPASHRSEAFGTVLLEAMAAGVPVISTELGTGTSWVNQDAVTGCVVAPGDPGALAGAISALLDDAALRRRLGDAARRRVMAEFTLQTMADRITEVYDAALQRKNRSARQLESP